MAYTPINWENSPSTATPLNATNLNKMDEAIFNLDQSTGNLVDYLENGFGARCGEITRITGIKYIASIYPSVTTANHEDFATGQLIILRSNVSDSLSQISIQKSYSASVVFDLIGVNGETYAEPVTANSILILQVLLVSGNKLVVLGNIDMSNTSGYSLAGIGKKTSVSSDIVDTDIVLHRAPMIGDKYLIYFDSRVNNPDGVTIYGSDDTDDYTLPWYTFFPSGFYLNGLCLVEVAENYEEDLSLKLIFRDELGVFTAGTGISINGNVIINTKPQLGDDIKAYDITTDVDDGNLGDFSITDDYIIINFKANAVPDSNGKYTCLIAQSSPVAILKTCVFKNLDGSFFSKNMYTGMSLICKNNDGGTGTSQDPVIITVIAINNGYVEAGRKSNTTVGVRSTAEGYEATASGERSHAEGDTCIASGSSSHAEGYHTTASGPYSHAEGANTTAGSTCHAEGDSTTASNNGSHAEGSSTQALYSASHAEGSHTEARNIAAHAEGSYCIASGQASHAEGSLTVASGTASHAAGYKTVAGYGTQAVVGRWNNNKEDTYFEVGNGTAEDARHNAFEVTASGHAKDGQGNDLASVAALEQSASGNPIVVNAQPVDAKELSVELEPIQDLHGYDHPWAGGAGKNKLKPFINSGLLNGVTWTLNSDGIVTSSGEATPTPSQPLSERFMLPQGNYFLSGCPAGGDGATYYLRVLGYDSSNNIVLNRTDVGSGVTFTVDETIEDLLVFANVYTGVTAPSGTWKPMIESGSSGTTYAPYSNICPISGRTETSVASIPKADYAPFFEGVKNGTYGFVDLGSLTWEYVTSGSAHAPYFSTSYSGIKSHGNPASNSIIAICKKYNVVKRDTTSFVDKTICGDGSTTAITYLNVKDSAYTDAATFKTAMSGVYLIYELATPTTPSYTVEQWAALVNSFGGNDATISFGQTVYGARINFKTGEGIVDRVKDDVTLASIYTRAGNANCDFAVFTVSSVWGSFDALRRSFMSDKTRIYYNNETFDNITDIGVVIVYSTDNKQLSVSVPKGYTLAQAQALFGSIEISYKIATPIILTLTPSMLKLLEGYNYITADGEMQLVYIPESVLPTPPTTDGTYKLICTVSNGVPTFSWVAN